MEQRPLARLSLPAATALVALAVVVARTLLAGAAALTMMRRDLAFGAALSATQTDLLVVGLCHLAGLAVAIGVGVTLVHGSEARYRDALAVAPSPPLITVLALVAGFALAFPMREAMNLLVEVAPGFQVDLATRRELAAAVRIDGWRDALLVPLGVVAVPAVFEELLFRGLLLPTLSRRYSDGLGLVLSATLFGAAHLEPLALLYGTAMGLVLGRLVQRTGSVMPAIALHGAFNAAPLVLDPALVRIEGFNTLAPDVEHLPLALVIGATVVAAGAITGIGRLTED